jgi:hypothetical protein
MCSVLWIVTIAVPITTLYVIDKSCVTERGRRFLDSVFILVHWFCLIFRVANQAYYLWMGGLIIHFLGFFALSMIRHYSCLSSNLFLDSWQKSLSCISYEHFGDR